MEPWELGRKLRKKFEGIESVWNAREFLVLDEEGRPMLESRHILKQGEDWIERIYVYENGEWMPKKDVSE